MSNITAYNVTYRSKDNTTSWYSGVTTDEAVYNRVRKLQADDETGIPQFKASPDANDHGGYNDAVKKEMETKQGGIKETSGGGFISGNRE